MRVMPANNRSAVVHYWAGRYPGQLGHLYSIEGFRRTYSWLPFGLDNGKFPAFTSGEPWDSVKWLALLDAVQKSGETPLWCLVPDVVGDRDATLREWDRWAPVAARYGWPLAFAVQDGMTAGDVPDAAVIFVGGSTAWKRRTMGQWSAKFPRVHVGRINTAKWLWRCVEIGAESCDGTGWFRGDPQQLAGLEQFLELYAAGVRTMPRRDPELFDGHPCRT